MQYLLSPDQFTRKKVIVHRDVKPENILVRESIEDDVTTAMIFRLGKVRKKRQVDLNINALILAKGFLNCWVSNSKKCSVEEIHFG